MALSILSSALASVLVVSPAQKAGARAASIDAVAPSAAYDCYDVRAYRLDVTVDTTSRRLSGVVGIEFVLVSTEGNNRIALDLAEHVALEGVELCAPPLTASGPLAGKPWRVKREGGRVFVELGPDVAAMDPVVLALHYSGQPPAQRFDQGAVWGRDAQGRPRLDVTCQLTGAEYWWPCKSAMSHPEDKPDRTYVNATVPTDLTAVSVGRLVGTTVPADERGMRTFHWVLDAPAAPWAVTLNVGAYESWSRSIELPGLAEPLRLDVYALPENAERARVQFAEVPEILACYSRAFGPYPFAESKLAIVDSMTFGATGATVLAYGSSYPSYAAKKGLPDEKVHFNRGHDRVLVHELAHAWWGAGTSAADWRHAWLHEGFAVYAEMLALENMRGSAAAAEQLVALALKVSPHMRVVPPPDVVVDGRASRRNYAVYTKAPCVLHIVRQYIDDDELFFAALRDFQAATRLGLATTDDLLDALERHVDLAKLTGKPFGWRDFGAAWLTGSGLPLVTGTLTLRDDRVWVEGDNPAQDGVEFTLPLDLVWTDPVDGTRHRKRVWLGPGVTDEGVQWERRPDTVEALTPLLGSYRFDVR